MQEKADVLVAENAEDKQNLKGKIKMEKRILKIDIAEILRKYEGGKYSFDLVESSSVIESNSDLREVDLDYTSTSSRHADTNAFVTEFKSLKDALRALRKEYNEYSYNGCGCGYVDERNIEIWRVDDDGEEWEPVETIPCPNSNLEDFMREWEKKIDDEFRTFDVVEWVNCSEIDEN